MSNKVNDLEEQYLLLEEEEAKENKRKLIFLLILFLLIIIISIIGATFSYNNYKQNHNFNPTETCTINCDTDKNGKPDINIDYEGDGHAHFNVDTDGDTKADFNLMNQDIDGDNKCDLNCDNNKDGWPDFNIDLDGDGIADLNIKEGGNKLTNMDTNGDGICDVKCNGIIDNDSTTGTDADIILTMEYQDNNIIHIGNIKTYVAADIIPGWKDVITFKIVNNTPMNGYYKFRWTDIVNTITETNNITYKLSKNNMLVLDETKAPYDNTDVLNKVLIPPKTTHTYKMMLEFKETGVDQSEDTNKEFSATFRAETAK